MLYLEAAIESPGRQGGGHSELQGAPGQGQVRDCGEMHHPMIDSGAGKPRHLRHNLRDCDGCRHCDHYQDLPF